MAEGLYFALPSKLEFLCVDMTALPAKPLEPHRSRTQKEPSMTPQTPCGQMADFVPVGESPRVISAGFWRCAPLRATRPPDDSPSRIRLHLGNNVRRGIHRKGGRPAQAKGIDFVARESVAGTSSGATGSVNSSAATACRSVIGFHEARG